MARRESVNGPGMEDEEAFINSMKLHREDREWTQSDLAKAMADAGWTGIYQTTISRIESGERPVRIGEARGIARVLKVPFREMMMPAEDMMPLRDLEHGVGDVRRNIRRVNSNIRMLSGARDRLVSAVAAIEERGVTEYATDSYRQQIDRWIEDAKVLMKSSKDIAPIEGVDDGVDK